MNRIPSHSFRYILSAISVLLSAGIQAQPWVFYPLQTQTKYYNGSVWGNTANQSMQADYTYANDRIAYFITKMWNGSSYQVNTQSIRVDYTYNGNNLDYTELRFWDGNSYELTDQSMRTEYTYNGNGQVDYETVKFYDSSQGTWYLGYQWIGLVSTRTEHYYNGTDLDYTITKYWNGSVWEIAYQVIGVLSTRTEYHYNAGKLDYTIMKHYDGSNWYIAYQTITAQSIRTEYTYAGNDLDYTTTKYYDGSNWYIGYQLAGIVSIRTEYSLYPLAVEEGMPVENMTVFPNPVTDRAFVKATTPLRNATVSVSDMQGRVVMQDQGVNGQRASLDLEALPRGVYMLTLAQDGLKVGTQRIVVAD